MTAGLRIACVGAGYFARFHLDAWRRIPEATLIAVADRDPAAAAATGLPAYPSAEAMLAAETLDLLDIILPPEAHASAVAAAIAAGIPAAICQKPFCTSLAEAEAATAAAEAAGMVLVIHENFRFMPWYRAIARALADGAIGTPHQASFRLRPGDGQGPRAYLDRQPYFQTLPRLLINETGVHWIDTFRFLFGDPTAVYADLRRLNPAVAGEDAGHVIFDHPGGLRALFDGNRHLDHASDNLRRTMGEALVEGTGGTLSLTGDGAVLLRRFGARTGETILPPDTWEGFGGDCVHALQSHVVSGLLRGTALENRARDYLAVLRVRDAIYRSAESGAKVAL